jgi:hypothetical protein
MPGAGYTVDGLFKLSNAATSAIPGTDSIPRLNLGNTWGGVNTFGSINSVGNLAMTAGGYISLGNGLAAYRNQSTSSIYSTGTGGAYPYNEAGHLVLEPRLSGAVRSAVFIGTGGVPVMVVNGGGNVSIGQSATGTARLHLPAGTATAGTAPFKFTTGVHLVTPEAGAIEYNGTNFYATPGTVRKRIVTMVEGTAAPVTGTWAVGELVYNTAPAAAGYLGWVCVTAGTPGTWKGFGLIEA